MEFWDVVADLGKVIFGGVFGAFGLKFIERYFDFKSNKLSSGSRKETQLMNRFDVLFDKLQNRVDTLETDFKELNKEHTKCLEGRAADQARISVLESWKRSVFGDGHGSQNDSDSRGR